MLYEWGMVRAVYILIDDCNFEFKFLYINLKEGMFY